MSINSCVNKNLVPFENESIRSPCCCYGRNRIENENTVTWDVIETMVKTSGCSLAQIALAMDRTVPCTKTTRPTIATLDAIKKYLLWFDIYKVLPKKEKESRAEQKKDSIPDSVRAVTPQFALDPPAHIIQDASERQDSSEDERLPNQVESHSPFPSSRSDFHN